MNSSYCLALFLTLIKIQLCQADDCEPTISTVIGNIAPAGPLCSGQLIFEENFDSINATLWNHEVNMWGGGNGEFQWYTSSTTNADCDNGILEFKPTLTTDIIPDLTTCHIVLGENCTMGCERNCTADNIAPPVQSARITTEHNFAFKYGNIEIRAKIPTGDWLWPAMWLFPQNSVYGGWPMSGDIDIMETRGNTDYKPGDIQIGVEHFESTLNFGNQVGVSAWWSAHMEYNTAAGRGLNQDFHLYQVQWTPDGIGFSVDGNTIGTIETGDGYFARGQLSGDNPWTNGGKDAPFDQEFFFILNLAIGGTNGFFPEDGNVGGKPWSNDATFAERDFWDGRDQWLSGWNFDPNDSLSSSFEIDYIHVFAI